MLKSPVPNRLNYMEESALISDLQRTAVKTCIEKSIPFALTVEPGEATARFFASLPDEYGRNEAHLEDPSWNGLFINFFGNDESYLAGVEKKYNEKEVLEIAHRLKNSLPGAEIELQNQTESKLLYLAAVASISVGLKRRGGKTVFSRLIAESGQNHIIDVAEEYFSQLPKTFRFLYFTSETGLWIGATPELLLNYDGNNGVFSTMALAGTRPVTVETKAWDAKNIEEHKIVVEFITDTLTKAGASVDVQQRGTMRFGAIEHLYTPISGKLESDKIYKHLCLLSPTPAVGGFPRKHAIGEIFTTETHSRHCYGGFVGLKENSQIRAFVNLRSAMAAPARFGKGFDYNLFVGGGITSRSNPEKEWEETEAKASLLRGIINPVKRNS